ncbi:CocE/NonD family hydrolase [Frigoriglobus tundricola]|uniref:Glutaryl-7-ACA acylase n=1 Tax=Frigoriglobus tundricola TaxID=2774151 RepID=A0A6M5Z2I1_9BACT|nr:CocE/NonD family hydrolase [Frigoriglobus tundricola]QJW99733.1 Glutaryl-7-ACA acylase [Frigoriglobus tundricola]
MRRVAHLVAFAAVCFLTVPTGRAQDKKAPLFDRTEAMVPMRDGTKLFTTIHVPKDAKEPLPIILMRTPYGIDGRTEKLLQNYFKELAENGYAFALQDIRGRFKSEGAFVMTRPARDPNDPKAVDEASDTSDTIDWLLKTVKNNNGRVGMLGISYPGWLTAVAMLDPHPALKAVSPQASPVDMFLGDDFHHSGAFRLSYGFEYVALMETDKTNHNFKFDTYDTYDWYLKLGGLANVNRKHFKNQLPTWNDFVAHPNYDAFWKTQSLEPRLKKVTVPTLNVAGWYDQEDFRGPLRIYELLEKHDAKDQNFLVIGPWNHGGWGAGKGDRLDRVLFGSDTGAYFRKEVQAPFFAKYLKDKGDAPPEARVFQTGSNKWQTYDAWPPKAAAPRKLYFQPKGKLSFDAPEEPSAAADEYVSDPANPVPYRPRPVRPTYPGPEWPVWMLQDQRFTNGRPDVLTYETDPLTEDLVIAGSMKVKLFGSTSGTDCDWIVRLIDVYPEDYAKPADMGGFQLLIAGEPVRARFRKSLEKPEAVQPGAVEEYTIDLNWGHHRFRKGHKVMVQVSSTWFPVIDRNPQKFVPNIFEAEDADFQKATQRVFRSAKAPSHLVLDVLPVK